MVSKGPQPYRPDPSPHTHMRRRAGMRLDSPFSFHSPQHCPFGTRSTMNSRRVRSLILSNAFADTSAFSAMPNAKSYKFMPTFIMKAMILRHFPKGDIESEVCACPTMLGPPLSSKDDVAGCLTGALEIVSQLWPKESLGKTQAQERGLPHAYTTHIKHTSHTTHSIHSGLRLFGPPSHTGLDVWKSGET